MVSTRIQRPAPYSMTSSECTTPIRRILNYNSGEDDLRIIRVQNMRFKVNAHILREGSPVFKSILHKSGDSPIVLSGHTGSQFRAFLWALYAQPLPGAKNLDIARLCSIAEVALKYQFNSLMLWSMDGIKTLVNAPDTLLRTAPSEIFVRLTRLALLYRDTHLSRSIQLKWLTRIHWHDLPPAPALVVADAYDLRHLLCHAYYVHLVDVSPRIARGQPIGGAGSPLTPTQNLHVFCGYHSLLALWRQLQDAAPAFAPAPTCTASAHAQRCAVAWAARWALEAGRATTLSPVDVLCRLLFMERQLEADEVLKACMDEGCRLEALDAVAKKRAEISDNLHHHFDL
ncbi:hypothetical protein B0H17DRAFT_1065016 [Mycena rosella]|uniref:BTB domain-containing protein n=1 Tax=Mycena rosella TaxID=1033263 RepID=A0AAD7DG21_MYCRO|nr:hypothetical protein B0H17DRAFT_1065016 [Mycena rosella]